MFSLPRLMTSTAVLAALFIAPTPRAHAQLAVIDPAAIAQAVEVVSNTLDQIKKLEEQLELAQDQLASITGERTFIVGINGNIEIHEVRGRIEEYENQIAEMKEIFKIENASTIFDEDRPEAIAAHDETVKAILANASSSEESIIAAADAIPRYEIYLTELGKSADLKESIDLNTRISIENGMMLSQLLHAISMQNNMVTHQQVEKLQRQHEQERLLGSWEFVALKDGAE